ncbi:uncharacterized protein LOC123265933 [Cotesia glomerata]|uniref:ZP domain-containing protein n=1 Tax=Cotesia glomerata TaxID=32391 RepID=A0AAV7IZH5_COTGL|nr:uncharacterized protein LOC123265933 [Cotesia glomerata]KAH0561334.1 hypothetical protein KQX54_016237 [Cotesia glomerata]
MVFLKTLIVLAILASAVKAAEEEKMNTTKIIVHCSSKNVSVKYIPEANIAGKFYFKNSTDPACRKEFLKGAEETLEVDYETCVPDRSKNFSIIVEYVNEANKTKKLRGSGSCHLPPVQNLTFSKGLTVKAAPPAKNDTSVEESDIEIEMIPIEVTSESALKGDLKLLNSEDIEVEEVTAGDKIKLEVEVSGSPEILDQYKKIFVESCVITSTSNESDKVEINYSCNSTDLEIPQWTEKDKKLTSEYTAKQLGEDNIITIDCSITACIKEEDCPKPECPEKTPARKIRDVLGRLLTYNLDMDDSKFETINVNSPPLTISGMKEK